MTGQFKPTHRKESSHTNTGGPCKVEGCRSIKYYTKSGKCVSCTQRLRKLKKKIPEQSKIEQLRLQKMWGVPCQLESI